MAHGRRVDHAASSPVALAGVVLATGAAVVWGDTYFMRA